MLPRSAPVITRLVTNDGVAASLTAESNAVASAPNATAKAGKLRGAYINHVRAQTGKSITPDAAAVLITFGPVPSPGAQIWVAVGSIRGGHRPPPSGRESTVKPGPRS